MNLNKILKNGESYFVLYVGKDMRIKINSEWYKIIFDKDNIKYTLDINGDMVKIIKENNNFYMASYPLVFNNVNRIISLEKINKNKTVNINEVLRNSETYYIFKKDDKILLVVNNDTYEIKFESFIFADSVTYSSNTLKIIEKDNEFYGILYPFVDLKPDRILWIKRINLPEKTKSNIINILLYIIVIFIVVISIIIRFTHPEYTETQIFLTLISFGTYTP